MDSKKIAIQVKKLQKQYYLGKIGYGTLTADLQSWVAKKIKKQEDPNRKIDASNSSTANKVFNAIDEVSFNIYRGERVGIIGGNGAGKSTLLKLLCRITAPTQGTIDYNGRISSMLEVGTGFNPEMTGRENIYLNGAILGMSKAEIETKLDQIIDFSECHEFIDTPVKRYSSGMFVKLAFSVAAHLDSEIVVMDEVLAVGDAKFQQKCIQKMKKIAIDEQRTVLFVSHNMASIRTLCERCIVLQKGKMIFDGETEKAISIYSEMMISDGCIFDLENEERHFTTNGAKLLRLEYINKTSSFFNAKENMKLRIVWEALENTENIYFRVDIDYHDTTVVGSTLCDFGQGVKGKRYMNEIEVDLTALWDGTYYYKIGLRKSEKIQQLDMYDIPKKIFAFEIGCVENELPTNHSVFGHTKLEKIKIIYKKEI